MIEASGFVCLSLATALKSDACLLAGAGTFKSKILTL